MIAENKIVSMHFTLKNSKGEQLETTTGQEAFEYLHGAMEILPALESELDGKCAGDKLTITIVPDDAYGERNEELIEEVDKSEFDGFDGGISEGIEIEMETSEGVFPVYISKIEGETVTVDMNHPLAGMTLVFDVEIISERDATEEELEHGYAHTDCDGEQ